MTHEAAHRVGYQKALAGELARLRAEGSVSQAAVAAELGIDQAAVSRVESGHRRLSVEEAFEWLEVLGLDPQASGELLSQIWIRHGGRPPGFWDEVSDG